MLRSKPFRYAILAGAALLIGCGEEETKDNPDDPQYQAGYKAGEEDGHTEGVNQVCNDAKTKKSRSMIFWLRLTYVLADFELYARSRVHLFLMKPRFLPCA